MRVLAPIAALVTATCLAAMPVHAEVDVPSLPTPGGFSVTPSVGTAFTVGGDFVKSGNEAISGSGTFGGVSVSGTGTISVNSKSFNDVYDTPVQLGISGNYGLTNRDEVSGSFRWLHADGKTFDAGTVGFNGTINGVGVSASSPFQARFDDYNEFGLGGGYKHFFDTPSPSFHPYLGAALGVDYTDSINVDLSANGTTIANGVNFYGAGWTWDAGLAAGFRYDVAPSFALGLETGIRYVGDLRSDHTDLHGDGGTIDSVNNGGDRWDIPLLLALTAKF